VKNRKALTVLAVVVLGVCLLTVSVENHLERFSWEMKQEVMFHQVLVRLDRLEEVYYQMGVLVEECIVAENRASNADRFQSYCAGAVCFVRDAPEIGYVDDLFSSEEKTQLEGIKEILSFPAKYEVDELELMGFSEQDLEKIKQFCFQLAECCDRGKEGTLAYCVNTKQVGSDEGRDAINVVKGIITEFEGIIE